MDIILEMSYVLILWKIQNSYTYDLSVKVSGIAIPNEMIKSMSPLDVVHTIKIHKPILSY